MSKLMTENHLRLQNRPFQRPSNAKIALPTAFQRPSNAPKNRFQRPSNALPTAFLPTPLYPQGVGSAALGSLEARPAGFQHAERAPLELVFSCCATPMRTRVVRLP